MTETLRREVDILIKARDLASFTLSKVSKGTGKLSKQTQNLIKRERARLAVDKANLAIAKKADAIAASRTAGLKKLQGTMLGFGLSTMFTGMAIKGFADNLIKGVSSVFMSLTDGSNETHNRINGLSAAFIHLKFSIFNSLAQTSLFKNFVLWLTNAANSLARFANEHPNVIKILGVFTVIASVLGGIMIVFGQMVLGVVGLIAGWILFGTKIMAVAALITGPVAAAILLIIVTFDKIWAFIKKTLGNIGTLFSEVWGAIKDLVVGVFDGIMLIFQGNFFEGIKTILGSIWNAFTSVFGAIGRFIVNTLIDALVFVVEAAQRVINILIAGFNKIPGVDIGKVDFSRATEFLEGLKFEPKAAESATTVVNQNTITYNVNGTNINDTQSFIDQINLANETQNQSIGTPYTPV